MARRFFFGIEHETAFLNEAGDFADFSNTPFAAFDAIIADLPRYEGDYPQLRVGDAGIKVKRWYIEGFERFDDEEQVIDCPPKGIEIRTTIHESIDGAVDELRESFRLMQARAAVDGFTPVWISFNPWRTEFTPEPRLTPYELARRQGSPEMQTAEIPMLTYGPDLSFSCSGLDDAALIDLGRKLTFYSPAIIPFSFSSAFYDGALWDGYSVRTWRRTGPRPAVMVFLHDADHMLDSAPSLTQPARVPAEAGRIEFKAFDSCRDFDLYASLLALLKGLALDETLPGRATTPDAAAHQRSARLGFDAPDIAKTAALALFAARRALAGDPDVHLLHRLESMLAQRETPAREQIAAYRQAGSVAAALPLLRYA